nr:ankyrin repeat domain-containing protein [Leptospiraceae bacterium]
MKLLLKLCFLFLITYSSINGEPNTDLLESASIGNLDGVKKALSEQAYINVKDREGTNALMFAANNNHFEVVKFLVDNKADVLARNINGWTAAVMAGVRGNLFIKEYLEGVEKTIPKSRATGVVLSIVGDTFVDNRKLQIGDLVLENQTIYVGKKSICELQIKQSLSEFTLRLKEDTVFVLKFKEAPIENIFSGFLQQGKALFKIQKVFTGEKIQAVTPTTVASVRGTAFGVETESDGKTKISVLQGSVRTRVRATGIEDDEIIEDTPEIKKLVSNLDYNAQIIPVGYSVEVTPEKQKSVLEKAEAEGLKNRAQRKEFSNAVIPDLSLRCSEKPVTKSMDPNELSTRQKELDDLVGVESAKLKNTSESPIIISLVENRKAEKEVINFQPDTFKKPEILLLKNGKAVKGPIYIIHNRYIVFSNVGKQ